MKQLFFSLSLLLVAMSLQAQDELNIDKGTLIVGGEVSFTSTSGDGFESTNALNLTPEVGYFISNGFALTLGVNLSRSGNDRSNFTSYLIQPGIRAYLYQGLFATANIGVGGARFSVDAIPDPIVTNTNLFEWGASIGYSFFLNKSIAVEPALFFTSQRQSGDNIPTTTGNTTGLSVGFRIFLD